MLILTTMDLRENIQNLITSIEVKRKQDIERVIYNSDRHSMAMSHLLDILEPLTSTLEKEGFSIVGLLTSKTGLQGDWSESDSLNVSLSLKPVAKKVKFLKVAGFTKSGAYKNDKML